MPRTADPRQELARLLPELRERVGRAVSTLQGVGDDAGALPALRDELQRLQGGFLFVGTPGLAHLGRELYAAATDLEAAAQAGDEERAQPLRAALLDALLRLLRVLERVAQEGESGVAEVAGLIDGLRRARQRPRYDALALLRQAVDPEAPGDAGGSGADIRKQRYAFQRGLLELLRGDTQDAEAQLRSVLEGLDGALGDSAAGGACWAALAAVDVLGAAEGVVGDGLKRSIAAYDRELRRLARAGVQEGMPEPSVVETLLRAVEGATASERVARVQAAASAWPGTGAAIPPPAEGVEPVAPVPSAAAEDPFEAYGELWEEAGEGEELPRLPAGTGRAVLGEAVAAELADDGEPEASPAAAAPGAEDVPETLEGLVPALERELREVADAEGRDGVLRVAEGAARPLPSAAAPALRDVLVELVRNAARHGIEAPGVRQRRGKPARGVIELGLRMLPGEALAWVEDDGGGLDGEALQRQVSDDAEEPAGALSDDEALSLLCLPGVSARGDGAGQGMARVAERVQDAGGGLEVASRAGSGARFTVRLPVPEAEGDPEAGAPRGHILVVNASRMLRRITAEQVGRAGFGWAGAGDLEQVRTAAAEAAPDAVLVDLEMGLGGAETDDWEPVLEAAGVADDAVVILSTRAIDGERLRELGLARARVLLKPHDEAQLGEALARACERGAGGGSEIAEGGGDGTEGDDGGGLGPQDPGA